MPVENSVERGAWSIEMKVKVAEKCGFCHGVENAISLAEKVLAKGRPVYSLGPIIHNKDVVRKLAKKGLKTVSRIDQIGEGTVLIRSHGVAPKQIAEIKKRGLAIVDATCVLVKRLQKIAKQLEREGYKVVIIGDKNHPEVQSVVGCLKDSIVVDSGADLRKLPKNKKLGIVCQTTQSADHFGGVVGSIVREGFSELKVINTLCREAQKRQASAVGLCKKVDVMFVLGGLDSANTLKLAQICKKYNSQTYHLQNWKEFDKRMVSGQKKAGVTAGASTPKWVIDDFIENLEAVNEPRSRLRG
jgi:4-hydroxy-3-methylbut-2-en-1-yl diphosphate reductase